MQLFHASNVEVRQPQLLAPNRLLDFGPGFYTTTNRVQAERFARGVVRRRGGNPFLNVYDFDEAEAARTCRVLRFDAPDAAWLDFVAANRTGAVADRPYDLVIGPVANDNVYATIGLYMRGFLSRSATLEELRVRKLYDQVVFCTPCAFRHISHVRTEAL